jgi:hypothetical protein
MHRHLGIAYSRRVSNAEVENDGFLGLSRRRLSGC